MGGGRGVEAVYASTRKEQKSSAPGHCSGPGFSFLPLLFCLPCCAARVSHQPEFSIPCGAGRPQKLGSRLHMRRQNGHWELALTAYRHQGSQKDYVGSLELNGVLNLWSAPSPLMIFGRAASSGWIGSEFHSQKMQCSLPSRLSRNLISFLQFSWLLRPTPPQPC